MQETFEVENFRKLHSFVVILESFLEEILGHTKSEQSVKVFSQRISYFSQIHEFSPSKVSCYTVYVAVVDSN